MWTVDPSKIITAEAKARDAALSTISARVSSLLDVGCPVDGDLHIAIDDASRADLGAMATTAIAALGGTLPWPESYRRGWITIENIRIPLATPADGIALAAPVGDYYASVRQRGRDLKDAVLAAETVADIAAIDLDSGWPE